jgi:protein farnesyltransferase/geranylgeranyltransferase type-1 subunit alpha
MELRGNPEWADVKPLAQDDGPAPVVPIAYPPRYVEVMDYLRAILALNEVSERALRLTTEAIAQNAANYTAWHHRRACLFALGSDLRAELAWAADLARASPKNYQLWHHVRFPH